MGVSYDPLLVVVSFLIAIQGSFVGLKLSLRVAAASGPARRSLIAGAAFCLAFGIWSMHFVGMLAAKIPLAVDYMVLPTLISFLVCVLVTGVAVYLASLQRPAMLAVAAIVMGLGITSMHYIGMQAILRQVHMSHDVWSVIASVMVAVAASLLALWLASGAGLRAPLLLSAAILGCAISGMHYTAMAGLSLHAMTEPFPPVAPAMSRDLLAVVASIAAFAVSGAFLITLVPAASHTPLSIGSSTASLPVNPLIGQAEPTNVTTLPPISTLPRNDLPEAHFVPIERNGVSSKISAGEIFYVHANAHYTYVFNGRDDLFCPLSISQMVARLPEKKFMRVHRSYIVNLQHVTRIRKSGDNGLAELDSPVQRAVPVSRKMWQPMRAQLAVEAAAITRSA